MSVVDELLADGTAQTLAAGLARRLDAVDRSLTHEVIRRFCQEVDDASLVATLEAIAGGARAGDALLRKASMEMALSAELQQVLSYERLERVYGLSHDRPDVRALFLSPRHRPNLTVDEAAPENEHLSLPLGMRKAAAHTRDREIMDRLVRDKNPQVVRLLLDNPRLIERDVVRIAAQRPTRPEVLKVVAEHPRWCTRYPVRKALACNPYTPFAIAQPLLGTLLLQDLRFVHGSGALSPEIREEARRLLQARA